MAKRDFYDVLGLNKGASDQAIKKAYRKLAKKYHPDSNPGDKAAEDKFKEVTEAYNVLSDSEKKKLYDQFGMAAFEEGAAGAYGQAGYTGTAGGNPFQGFSGFGGSADGSWQEVHFGSDGSDINMDDILRHLFHGGASSQSGFSGYTGDPFTGQGSSAHVQDADVEADMQVTLEEAAFGADKTLQLRSPADGKVQSLRVHVPAGIEEGRKIRLRGKGRTSCRGTQGDLYLKVHILPKDGYERKGNDLYTTVRIPYTTAVLGGETIVPTLSGTVSCKVPAGIQSGGKIRLKGKGIVSMKDKKICGDQYVTIQIEVPRNLSARAKQKLREFQEAM